MLQQRKHTPLSSTGFYSIHMHVLEAVYADSRTLLHVQQFFKFLTYVNISVIPVPGVAGVGKLLGLHPYLHLFLGLDIDDGMVHHVLDVSKAVRDVLGVSAWVCSGSWAPISGEQGSKW